MTHPSHGTKGGWLCPRTWKRERKQVVAVLETLRHGPTLARDVAAELRIKVNVASAVLSELHQAGLVTRKRFQFTEPTPGLPPYLYELPQAASGAQA